MVRVFHGGENGQHDYKLYDLSKDISESNNMAAKMPERVERLDRMIEEYLKETGAVIPMPNPNFDPKQFDPAAIGVRPRGKN